MAEKNLLSYVGELFYKDLKYFYKAYSQSTQYETQKNLEQDINKIFEHGIYCFLTPATKSDSADYTCKELLANDFFALSEEDLASILRKPPYIRFHNQKATRLLWWQQNGLSTIRHMLTLPSAFQKREFLVQTVKGMGYKEASHFLRNIGQSEDLVILDRHIIQFMKNTHFLKETDSFQTLSRNYYSWELIFQQLLRSHLWLAEGFLSTDVPRADFAIWASGVKNADSSISYERVLMLK